MFWRAFGGSQTLATAVRVIQVDDGKFVSVSSVLACGAERTCVARDDETTVVVVSVSGGGPAVPNE